jgi:hypothetical protein
MRIQDRTSLGPSAAETGRTAETQKPGRGSTGQTGPANSSDGDRIELSSALGRLSQAVVAYGTQRGDRVQALSVDYQAGRFRPDSQATSRAIVAEALSAPG